MITFVNLFTVPAGREEEFLALWTEVNRYMAAKPGYVSHALHRSLDPAAGYRFVNLAEWESADAWRAAHDAGFRALVQAPQWRDFTTSPALYEHEPVHAGRVAQSSEELEAPSLIRSITVESARVVTSPT